jgi:hypothetical protein
MYFDRAGRYPQLAGRPLGGTSGGQTIEHLAFARCKQGQFIQRLFLLRVLSAGGEAYG